MAICFVYIGFLACTYVHVHMCEYIHVWMHIQEDQYLLTHGFHGSYLGG